MKYRDTKTGRFVSAATWRRSRTHGGTRYRRLRQTVSKRTKKPGRGAPRRSAVGPTAPPSSGPITVQIPAEFLIAEDDFYESGYESDEEDEYQ